MPRFTSSGWQPPAPPPISDSAAGEIGKAILPQGSLLVCEISRRGARVPDLLPAGGTHVDRGTHRAPQTVASTRRSRTCREAGGIEPLATPRLRGATLPKQPLDDLIDTGESRTHSIGRSERPWSADCLPCPGWLRRD